MFRMAMLQTKRALVGILVVAALLRVVHLTDHLGIGLSAPESVPNWDMNAFAVWGARIANGDVLSANTYHPYMDWMQGVAPLATFEEWWGGAQIFHQEPLYAYLVALSFALTGGKLLVLLLQIACSVFAVYLVFRIATVLANERAGLAAAALAALYAPWIVYDTLMLRESLATSLTVAAIFALLRVREAPMASRALAAGALLGIGLLLRPTGAVLLAGPVVLLLDRRTRNAWRRWVPALAGGVAIVLAPAVARNLVVRAPPLSLSTRAPETVIHGNHVDADPGFLTIPQAAPYREMMERGHGSVPAALGAAVTSWPEENRIGWWLWHEWRKLQAIFRDTEYSDNANFYFYRRATPILRFLPTFGSIVGLALVGSVLVARRGRDRTAALLVALAAAGTIASMLLTFAGSRYRLPLAILATIPAAVAVAALIDWIRERRWAPAASATAFALVVTLASYRIVPTRVAFYPNGEALFVRGAEARLFEDLVALRALEFHEEVTRLAERGEDQRSFVVLADYLREIHRTIETAPPWDDLTVRRYVLNTSYVGLEHAARTFAQDGHAEHALAIERELEWIRTHY